MWYIGGRVGWGWGGGTILAYLIYTERDKSLFRGLQIKHNLTLHLSPPKAGLHIYAETKPNKNHLNNIYRISLRDT